MVSYTSESAFSSFGAILHATSHRYILSLRCSLAAAKSIDLRRQFGITHVVSVCQDYPLHGPNHLVIPVQDSEYDDILIHLPDACRFIQNTLDGGGRVLVHCFMGISRSATVIAAYCEIIAPWESLKADRNSPQTSDVDSPYPCPQGDCHHQERSLISLTRLSLSYLSHCSSSAGTAKLWLHKGTSRL